MLSIIRGRLRPVAAERVSEAEVDIDNSPPRWFAPSAGQLGIQRRIRVLRDVRAEDADGSD